VAKAQVQGAQRQQDWMLCADEKDVKIYRAEDKVHTSTHGTMYMYAGTTQVVGAVDEFVALFKNETTIEAKEYCRRFANRLMDSVVLYALVKPSEEQPYERIGINWRAFESWGGKLFQNRDSCLLECHHEFYVGSRRGWVCSLISVDLECCPSLEDTLGLVRQCDYGSGHVVLESHRRGYLDVTYITHTNVGVGKSEWIYNSLGQIPRLAEISLKSRVRHVSKIDRFLREDRLSRTPCLDMEAFMPLDAVASCCLCSKKFKRWSQRLNCWKCGIVTCRHCSRAWTIKQHGFPVLTNVCTKCSLCQMLDSGDFNTMYDPMMIILDGSEASTTPHSAIMLFGSELSTDNSTSATSNWNLLPTPSDDTNLCEYATSVTSLTSTDFSAYCETDIATPQLL
ncbi:hypothetical protein LEN26_009292, partial [Aphanomyces euteiches]